MKANRFVDTWLGPLIGLMAATLGWIVPEFYDWTGADQSRPAPIVNVIALAMLVSVLVLNATLLWLHYSERWPQSGNPTPIRFGTQHLLSLTAISACLIALGLRGLGTGASYGMFAIVCLATVVLFVRFPPLPWVVTRSLARQLCPLFMGFARFW